MAQKEPHNQVKIIFLLAIVTLTVLSMMSYARIQNLIYETKLINHTEQVKLELNKILSTIQEVESNLRGFILTRDSVFLTPVFTAETRLHLHINNMASLTLNNPTQHQNVNELRKLVFNRLNHLHTLLAEATTSPINNQKLLHGKLLMENVRKLISTMEREEDIQLNIRTASLNQSVNITPVLTIALMMGSIILLFTSYFKIMRELRISDTLKSKIEQSEERYHRMISEVKDYAIIFLNKEGIIENWNAGAQHIKGYKAEEIIGNSFKVFYTEHDRENRLPEILLAKAKQNETALDEGWRVRKDGSVFWASVVITALHDENNNIIGFSKVTRDLTSKKLAEDEIKEMNKELKHKNIELQSSNKELEAFNYISSHDLQEPLRQIQMFSSRISEMEQRNLSVKGKDYFEKLHNAANRMQSLITDLLAYSRAKTDERKFILTNLKAMVNHVSESFVEIIDEKHALIEVEEGPGINVIPLQFRQLMHNLIGNALKFSKPDTPPHIVIKNQIVHSGEVNDVNLAVNTEYYHISVSDNGIGFEPQYKDRIFEVFQRLHDKQKIAGTGIGLAIVKKIVDNHNGFITTSSQINQGATFNIYIPTVQNL